MAYVEDRPETPTPEILHDQVRNIVVAPVEHTENVGAIERCSRLRFSTKAMQELRIMSKSGVQHLDRDPAAQRDVICEVDARRCPGTDRCQESVSAAKHTAYIAIGG